MICFIVFRIHKYSIHLCIILLLKSLFVIYFLVLSFSRYKEYMICLISCSKCSDVLTAFTCAGALGNLQSICVGVNTLKLKWSDTLSEKPLPSTLVRNILLSKASRTLSLPSKSAYKFLWIYIFFLLFSWILSSFFS